MTVLFGTKYLGFIAAAYGVTSIGILALVIWVLVTQRARRKELASLEEAGLKRVSAHNG